MLSKLEQAIRDYGTDRFFKMLLDHRDDPTRDTSVTPVVTIPGIDHEIHIFGANLYRNCQDEWCAMYIFCIDGEEYYSNGTWDDNFTTYDPGLDPLVDIE